MISNSEVKNMRNPVKSRVSWHRKAGGEIFRDGTVGIKTDCTKEFLITYKSD